MHTTHRLALLLAPVLLVSTLRTGDELAFKPEAASQVKKTYTHKLELALEEMHFKVDDEEMPDSAMGEFELHVTDESELVFTDTYVTLAAQGPKVLERKFESLASDGVEKVTTDGGEEEHRSDRESKLEGKTVVFTRAEDAGECEVAFKKDGEGDKALLADLVEDTDLRAFLPSKAVADGDTWEVDGKTFNALFAPGGDLHLEKKDDDNDRSVDRAKLRANMEGKAKVTYKGERDEKGVKVAVLALEFEVKSSSDTDIEVESWTQHNDYALELKLEGELLWDRKLGRARALDLHGDAKVKVVQTSHSDDEEEGGDWEQTLLLKGSASFVAKFEGAE